MVKVLYKKRFNHYKNISVLEISSKFKRIIKSIKYDVTHFKNIFINIVKYCCTRA